MAIFILFSLFTIVHGMVFLLTHPLPYETLGVDLHFFVKNNEIINSTDPVIKSILMIGIFNLKNKFNFNHFNYNNSK